MKWYNMAFNNRTNWTSLMNIENEFEHWKKNEFRILSDDNTINLSQIFDEKMDDVAEKHGFSEMYKSTLIKMYMNEKREILIGWHSDHDRKWSFSEQGFDLQVKPNHVDGNDLIDYYYREDLILESELPDIFLAINNIDRLTEKQQSAILHIFEYCKLSENEKSYLDKPYNANEYQTIYHNVWKNKKLQQKLILHDFLEFLDFFK